MMQGARNDPMMNGASQNFSIQLVGANGILTRALQLSNYAPVANTLIGPVGGGITRELVEFCAHSCVGRAVNYTGGSFVRVPAVNRPISDVHATRSDLRVERSVIACTFIGMCFRALWRG